MRLLPEGGMVIIAADGRKLWFSADEVNAAREKLTQPVKPVKSSLPPVKLTKARESGPAANKGMPIYAAIADNLKVDHDHPHRT